MAYVVHYPKVDGNPAGEKPDTENVWNGVNPENYRELVAFVSCQRPLADRVIVAANAAIHGPLAHRITSVDKAIFMLGVERVVSLAEQTLAL